MVDEAPDGCYWKFASSPLIFYSKEPGRWLDITWEEAQGPDSFDSLAKYCVHRKENGFSEDDTITYEYTDPEDPRRKRDIWCLNSKNRIYSHRGIDGPWEDIDGTASHLSISGCGGHWYSCRTRISRGVKSCTVLYQNGRGDAWVECTGAPEMDVVSVSHGGEHVWGLNTGTGAEHCACRTYTVHTVPEHLNIHTTPMVRTPVSCLFYHESHTHTPLSHRRSASSDRRGPRPHRQPLEWPHPWGTPRARKRRLCCESNCGVAMWKACEQLGENIEHSWCWLSPW